MVAARGEGTSGRALATEPHPYNVDRIERNAACNGFSNVEAICAAAGAEDGFVQFRLRKPRDRARPSLALPSSNDLNFVIEVPIRRMDTILAARSISSIKLMKIDGEGSELDVLRSLGKRLVDCENIVFEVSDNASTERTQHIVRHSIESKFLLKNIEGRQWKMEEPPPESYVWTYPAWLHRL